MMGWLLVVIGLLFAFFGIGGSAKLNLGKLGVVSAGSGVILIIVGVLFMSSGI